MGGFGDAASDHRTHARRSRLGGGDACYRARRGRTLNKRLKLTTTLAWLLGVGLSSAGATPPAAPPDLARWLFSALEVRRVPCPAYAFQGDRQPRCGTTPLGPEAFAEAVDGLLERTLATEPDVPWPSTPWTEDHGVWLRYFERGGAHYALLHTPLDPTFNVQLVRVE